MAMREETTMAIAGVRRGAKPEHSQKQQIIEQRSTPGHGDEAGELLDVGWLLHGERQVPMASPGNQHGRRHRE